MVLPLEEMVEKTRHLHFTDADEVDILEPGSHPKQYEPLAKTDHDDKMQFIPYYVNVVDELHLSVSKDKVLSRHEKKLLVDYQKREGLSNIGEILDADVQGGCGEKYEQSKVKHGDRAIQKFLKQISLCNDQCLRYSMNGKPLLMTAEELGEIPRCSSCGKRRVFELQLMPALVLLLQTRHKLHNENSSLHYQSGTTHGCSASKKTNTDSKSLEREKSTEDEFGSRIEFGTVYIYSCSDNCWSNGDKFHEEYVAVQSEPADQKLMSQF